jgi:hypothetical protein
MADLEVVMEQTMQELKYTKKSPSEFIIHSR